MLDRLITFALHQRVFVIVATLVLVIFGWRALDNLPIEAFPDVQDVQVQIITQAQGKAPEEVERSVTLPIERGVNGVPQLTQLRSVSITGLSVVTLTFADNTDDYFARQQVMERLQEISLPSGIQPTLAPLSTAVGEIYRYILDAPPSFSVRDQRELQDWVLDPAIRGVPGVADVNSFGGLIKEYQVQVNPFLLKKFNVGIDQVSQALGNANNNVGGGLFHRGEEDLVVRGIGLANNLDDIGATVIATRNGSPILLRDIGVVTIGNRQPSGIVGMNERDSVVEGIVVMTKGQNATTVVAALKEKLQQLQRHLPPGVKIQTVYDRTDLIKHTVHTVAENLITGAVLVIAILLIFLREWRTTLIVAAVIPLALLFAFVIIDFRGMSANLISLGAVDFGIIIDSAVVLVEALMVRLALQRLQNPGHPGHYGYRLQTLRHTATDLSRPILFAKAIIILAFMPIFTFQRVEGKIFSPMAFTLSFALLGAVLLTLTLVPTLLSYVLKHHTLEEKHSSWLSWLQNRYRRLLESLQRRRLLAIVVALALLGISLAVVPLLGSEFLPKLDEGNIWLTVELPPSTALDKTKEVERYIRQVLRSYPEVGNVVTQVGRPDDGTDPKGPNNIEIMADLKPHSTWRFDSKDALINDMSRNIDRMPGVPTNFSQVIEDNVEESLSGVKGEIAVKIFGPDLDVLEAKGEAVAALLRTIRGASDVDIVKINGQSELDIELDHARMARFGLNSADVNTIVQLAMGGNTVNTMYEADRSFDITVRIAEPYRHSLQQIADLPLNTPSGTSITLGQVAHISIKQGASQVFREAGGRIVAVKANLLGRDQGSFVAEAEARVKQQISLPPGYRITWGGQFENQQRAMKRLGVIVPVSLLLIFVLLFWVFRSMRKALLVLGMIPFSLIGGIAGLGLTGLHLSVSAAVGFIALAGISVQNGVIMVEEIIGLLRNGKSQAEAVLDGAVLRLRPVLMTGLMAGLGLLPAALSHGIGSETQRPFAVVIVGGIITATLFTLMLLPLIFPLMGRDEN